MHLGQSTAATEYSIESDMGRMLLKTVNNEKELDIWVDEKLKMSQLIGHMVAKGNQLLGLVKRAFVHKDMHLIKTLITSVIRPHFEYGNVVWSPRYNKDMESLDKVQGRATQMIPGFEKMNYSARLQKLDLPTLNYTRHRGDMIEVYKYTHHLYTVQGTNLMPQYDIKTTVKREETVSGWTNDTAEQKLEPHFSV